MEKRIRLREEEIKVHHSESHRRKLAEQLEKQQDNLLAAIKKTNMPSRTIYTDSMDWDRYAKAIVGAEWSLA